MTENTTYGILIKYNMYNLTVYLHIIYIESINKENFSDTGFILKKKSQLLFKVRNILKRFLLNTKICIYSNGMISLSYRHFSSLHYLL